MRSIASVWARIGLLAIDASRLPARALAAALVCSTAAIACSSPTGPSPVPYVEASQPVIHAGDTISFILVGFSPDRPVSWQFETIHSGTVAFVPVINSERGDTPRPGQTHVNSLRIVRVMEATRFTAEAWTVGGVSDTAAARRIASFTVDALP